MDVNGSRFHLLLTEDDWARGEDLAPVVSVDESDQDQLEWRPDPAGLTLARRGFLFSGGPGRPVLDADRRRGADRDEYGTWYTIGEDGVSVVEMLADGTSRTMWPTAATPIADGPFETTSVAPPAEPLLLAALAVTDDHRLVVGVPARPDGEGEGGNEGEAPVAPAAGLLVFDLYRGSDPSWLPFPDDFDPVDAEAVPGGGLVILDRGGGSTRYWCLDRHLTSGSAGAVPTAESPFEPKDGAGHEPRTVAPRVDPDGGFTVDVPGPRSIVSLPDGSVLIMGHADGAPASTLHRFDRGTPVGDPIELLDALVGFVDGDDDVRTDVIGHDLAFVADETERDANPDGGPGDPLGVLYVSDAGGDQVFAFTLSGSGIDIVPTYLPMRLHHGRALVAAGGAVFFDTVDRWHELVANGRQRHTTTGTYTSTAYDGGEPGCVWHRVFLDGCIPPGAEVVVETRAADRVEDLARQSWSIEPALYRRADGSELPRFEPTGRDDPVGTWETLLQAATGRHLQFRLTLSRTGGSPPRIGALRLYFPRFSYREEYLPRVYGEDRRAADLLDRYLAGPEGLLSAIEARIVEAQTLFDHRTTPDRYLDWLAGWLGADFDADWEPTRKRVFLDHVDELFRQRGTRPGLIAAVRLAIEDNPRCAFDEPSSGPFGVRIVETFETRAIGTVALGDPTDISDVALVDAGDRWSPEQGGAVLQTRFRSFVADRRPGAPAADGVLRPTTPDDDPNRDDWTSFLATELGVTDPSFTADDLATYRRYLVQRYRRFAEYEAAYGPASSGTSFDTIELPTVFPVAGQPLRDWTTLLARVLPVARQAHRFSVLVPIPLQATDEEQRLLIDRVRHVVERQRPAHTSFDVRPFWAALRVGGARVGFETQVGLGSRFVPLIVGRGRLAKTYLTAPDRYDRRLVVDDGRALASIPSNRREDHS